jgi:dTDP-4-dehydrorhamnose 3,5-epimerase
MSMVEQTKIAGCVVVNFPRRGDDRGWFQRAFSLAELAEAGISFTVEQANVALTERAGTVRGMHYQVAPYGEQKMFRCVRGEVFDVIVDLRSESETYLQWVGITLSEENGLAVVIPKGCAHGYLALQNDSQVVYFVDQAYEPTAERIMSVHNQAVAIEWPMPISSISDKDAAADPAATPAPSGY